MHTSPGRLKFNHVESKNARQTMDSQSNHAQSVKIRQKLHRENDFVRFSLEMVPKKKIDPGSIPGDGPQKSTLGASQVYNFIVEFKGQPPSP